MMFLRKNSLFLMNSFLFLLVGVAVFSDSIFATLFCLGGVLFNLFLFLKNFLSKSIKEAQMFDSQDELNLHEKDLIMEDLDREVTRRRETKQINKN
jgi:hypothetical protein